MGTERFLRAPTLYFIIFLILSKNLFRRASLRKNARLGPLDAISIILRVTCHARRLEKLTFEHGRNVHLERLNYVELNIKNKGAVSETKMKGTVPDLYC